MVVNPQLDRVTGHLTRLKLTSTRDCLESLLDLDPDYEIDAGNRLASSFKVVPANQNERDADAPQAEDDAASYEIRPAKPAKALPKIETSYDKALEAMIAETKKEKAARQAIGAAEEPPAKCIVEKPVRQIKKPAAKTPAAAKPAAAAAKPAAPAAAPEAPKSAARTKADAARKALEEAEAAAAAEETAVASAVKQPGDVIDAFVQLAKEEGHQVGNDCVYVVNIGSPTDNSNYHRLAIALADFIHFKLRKALGENRMDILTWKTAQSALYAAGVTPTGKSKYVLRTSDLRDRLIAQQEKSSVAITELLAIKDWLKSIDGDTSARMEKAMNALKIGEIISTDDDDAPDPETFGYKLSQFVDDFQRFTSLGEDGKSLMEEYEKLAFELFHVVPGREQGYVVLCAKTKKKGETSEAFVARQREVALELLKKLKTRLEGYPQLSRLVLHPASFGEVVTLGYEAEDRDIITIDSAGTARAILSVTEHALGQSGKMDGIDPQLAAHLMSVRDDEKK